MIESLISAWQSVSTLEFAAVAFGVIYIVLAARENSWCWYAAFIGTGLSIVVFWDVSLLMESALNVYYLLMAVYGWHQWHYGNKSGNKSGNNSNNNNGSNEPTPISIHRLSIAHHLLLLTLIALLTLISGYLLSRNADAAFPYLDSFTTWSAVVTTWMVAKKILENWLYWIVIDAISVWLYLERGLPLYALLMAAYTIIAIFGFYNWYRRYNNHAGTQTETGSASA